MRKWIDIVLKVVLSLILITPILGLTGLFPPPTRDLYNTDEAFAFIQMMTEGRYISVIMAVVHILALLCLWTRRTGLAERGRVRRSGARAAPPSAPRARPPSRRQTAS